MKKKSVLEIICLISAFIYGVMSLLIFIGTGGSSYSDYDVMYRIIRIAFVFILLFWFRKTINSNIENESVIGRVKKICFKTLILSAISTCAVYLSRILLLAMPFVELKQSFVEISYYSVCYFVEMFIVFMLVSLMLLLMEKKKDFKKFINNPCTYIIPILGMLYFVITDIMTYVRYGDFSIYLLFIGVYNFLFLIFLEIVIRIIKNNSKLVYHIISISVGLLIFVPITLIELKGWATVSKRFIVEYGILRALGLYIVTNMVLIAIEQLIKIFKKSFNKNKGVII